ncbi:hypothetical protein [uncultured Desulfovibrio sp.]|uniref:hypothetical protein n=1 Tax=uncultured Desulfovibrio sp. TaxID=167968 RepID=UPI00261DE814|nr:hypothetical protein [uncultured Desulfovibrio sp.]
MNCIRTDEEIARVENWAGEAVDDGTHNPGKSYEDGVYDTLMWLHGGSEKAPDEVGEEE